MKDNLKETAVDHLEGYKWATVTTGERKWLNKIAKLQEKSPEDVQVVATNPDGSIVVHIPFDWVKLSLPRKVNLTEEQRTERATRLSEMRARSRETGE